jgi:hypothetical protein
MHGTAGSAHVAGGAGVQPSPAGGFTAAGQAKMLRYRGIAWRAAATAGGGRRLPTALQTTLMIPRPAGAPRHTRHWASGAGGGGLWLARGAAARGHALADQGRGTRRGRPRSRRPLPCAPVPAPAPPTQLAQTRPAAARPRHHRPRRRRRRCPALQVVAQAAPAQSSRLAIVGDEGVVCATAIKGPLDTMPAVTGPAAIRRSSRRRSIARVLRYRGRPQRRRDGGGDRRFRPGAGAHPEDTWAPGRAEAHEALGHNPQAIADYKRLAAAPRRHALAD